MYIMYMVVSYWIILFLETSVLTRKTNKLVLILI